MTELKIKDARLTLKNGTLTVRSRDLDPPASQDSLEADAPEAENAPKKPKTTAERQRELYERRKADGWRKVWVDPQTLELAEMLGGIERIPADREAWIARAADFEKRCERPWWRFW